MTTEDDEDHNLEREIQQAFEWFAARCGVGLTDTIRPIVLANLKKGRVRYFLDDSSAHTALDYLYRVAGYYEQWHDYLCQLQREKQPELWLVLYKELQRSAIRYLRRRGFPSSEILRLDLHIDCAVVAAERLLRANFPYDTAFTPWVTVLVHRASERRLKEALQQTELEVEPTAAEYLDDWWNLFPDPKSLTEQSKIETIHDLMRAIEQLPSEAQKQVIILRDIEDISYPDIAVKLGKKTSAVHKLHHDAVKNLRKILGGNGDNNK